MLIRIKLFLIVSVTILGLITAYILLFPKSSSATRPEKVYVCHCERPDSESPFQCQTLHIAPSAAEAHLEEHDTDYEGRCEEPTPSPSSSPEPDKCEVLIKQLGDREFRTRWTDRCYESPENLAKCVSVLKECEVNVCRVLTEHPRCQQPTPTPTPSPTPTPTPTPEPTPTLIPESAPQALSNAGVESVACVEIKHAPTALTFNRLSPTSVHITWSKVDEGINTYLVSYGLNEDADMWNTIVEGNETTLNFLPENLSIWFKVAGISVGGCVGRFGVSVDP